MSEFTAAQLLELEGLIKAKADERVRAFMNERMVTPHDAPGLFAFNGANPNIDQTRKASIDSTRDNLNDLNSRVTALNGAYVPITGGTMTGDLTIGGGADNISRMHLQAPAAGYADILWSRGGKLRYNMTMDNSAESGANAGSHFYVYRYADDGVTATPLLIMNRTTGAITHRSNTGGGFTLMDNSVIANGTLWFGDQSAGARGILFNTANGYTFQGTVPVRASTYQFNNEVLVTMAGNITLDVAASGLHGVTVNAAGSISFVGTYYGHWQVRVIAGAAVAITFPSVTLWLGAAGPPTALVAGQQYMFNFFSSTGGIFAQWVKSGV